MTSSSSSADQIEDELRKARAHLGRLQKRQVVSASATASSSFHDAQQPQHQQQHQLLQHQLRRRVAALDDDDDDDDHDENVASSAELELFQRAQKLQDQIDILHINHSMLQVILPPTLSASSSSSSILSAATDLCTKLGLILLQQQQQQQQHDRQRSLPYYEAILNWYNSLHKSTRTMACITFQRELRKHAPEFPSTEASSRVVSRALSSSSSSSASGRVVQLSSSLPSTSGTAVSTTSNFGGGSRYSDGAGDANTIVNGSDSLHEYYAEWNMASKSIVELQVMHDALLLLTTMGHIMPDHHHQPHLLGSPYFSSSSRRRLDILDGLCRPLAERVKFHFLEEKSGGLMSNNNSGGSSAAPMTLSPGEKKIDEAEDSMAHHHHHQISNFERLPEWLFQYLREVVQDHGMYSLVILEGVQPLMNSVMESLIVRATAAAATKADIDDEMGDGKNYSTMTRILHTLKRQYCNQTAPTYYLREVARMARHVLRAKSYFHHPDVVGSACRDRAVVLRGIEQLFLFDDFLVNTIQLLGGGGRGESSGYDEVAGINGDVGPGSGRDDKSSILSPPKMVDAFLSTDEFLLQWWLEEERDGILTRLRQCASVTLLHAQTVRSEESDGGAPQPLSHRPEASSSSSDRQQSMYPPISELFIALLHAARWKSNAFTDQHCRQLYTAEVIAPMCSEYLDMVHAEAAWLRKRLLARRTRSNLPSDEVLMWNVMEWCSLITGTNLVAEAILSCRHPLGVERRSNFNGNLPVDDSQDELCLDRVGDSMKRLCTAMIDEFASAFIETIVMERAKLASYMMRTPFILSEPPLHSERHNADESYVPPSPDLSNSIHVVATGVMACNKILLKLRKMLLSSSDGAADQATWAQDESRHLLYFGGHSIRNAIKFAIGQKLLDIAIDPQGMTPEICLGGAIQFRRDVLSFSRLFDEGDSGNVAENEPMLYNPMNEPGPMERAETASRLMSLESPQIRTLREALRALLVGQNSASGSIFSRGGGKSADDCFDSEQRLIVDDFCNDARLMDEATSMIEAKGFGALSLDEALTIINRRF